MPLRIILCWFNRHKLKPGTGYWYRNIAEGVCQTCGVNIHSPGVKWWVKQVHADKSASVSSGQPDHTRHN